MTHICHAKGCTTSCKPEYLMCSRHWRMVPRRTQLLVYKHYQKGQCGLSPMPSPKWHAAADVAIAQVAFKENRISQATLNRIIEKAKTVLRPMEVNHGQ